jgi:4-amino-4-deoxy-L-arabinose transferase-like glycosyltransferase
VALKKGRPGRSKRPAPSPAGATDALRTGGVAAYGAWFVLAVVVLLIIIVRVRLAAVPLERDEGEYAYAGQLILHGIPPFALAYNMKFPGTYYAYSVLLAIFGHTATGIHLGLLVVNLATLVIVFRLGKRWLGSAGAALGAAWFGVLSLDRGVMGLFGHATHFVVLPALAGLLVLLRALDSKRAASFVWAGVLLGLATLMKQPGICFLFLGFVLVVWERPRRSFSLAAGAIVPVALLCLVLVGGGVFGRFWFWAVHYAREYVGVVPLDLAWAIFITRWQEVTRATMAIWILAAGGLAALWLTRWPSDARVFLSGLLVAGGAAIAPGFYFRAHYWVLALPAVALLAAAAVVSAERAILRLSGSAAIARVAMLAASVALLAAWFVAERQYCFSIGPVELSRATFGANPFPEAVDIAAYIRARTAPTDRIAVLGSEPEIYFYADRASATGYIYTYPFMENQPYSMQMQREMADEVQAARPAYLVMATMTTSWSDGPFSNQPILRWSQAYSKQCYDLVGIADIGDHGTRIVWGPEATTYNPGSLNVVLTFQRKSGAYCTVAFPGAK